VLKEVLLQGVGVLKKVLLRVLKEVLLQGVGVLKEVLLRVLGCSERCYSRVLGCSERCYSRVLVRSKRCYGVRYPRVSGVKRWLHAGCWGAQRSITPPIIRTYIHSM